MKNKFLLTAVLVAGTLATQAQQNKKTYAITGDGNNDYVWMNIRQVDLGTGQVTKNLFERSKTNFTLTDVNSKQTVNQLTTAQGDIFSSVNYPTGTFVAAAAYDARTQKLFFTPMRMGELRWLDLSDRNETPKFFSMHTELMAAATPGDEATNITRMVIGADGNGYALSNDGNRFLKFTTAKKPVITDLGNLIDADGSTVSIHNKCSSWGGDMIADAFGKLYVISASQSVFMIDPATRIATYKGHIQGLPAGYTTNAAAVNDDGEIVVGSAIKFDGFYKMKLADLKAVRIEGSDIKYNASDFANANLLLQKEADASNSFSMAGSVLPIVTAASETKVFPNPVINAQFNVLFDGRPEGRYTIVLSDLAGRAIQSKTVNITKGSQVEKINLNSGMAKGVYLVKVLDQNKAIVLTEKIIVQ
jgi:hypothetical protein